VEGTVAVEVEVAAGTVEVAAGVEHHTAVAAGAAAAVHRQVVCNQLPSSSMAVEVPTS